MRAHVRNQADNPKEKPAVQAHIVMLQGIINRVAGNSANCKTWTVAIIGGILSMSNIGIPFLFISLLICVVFLLLDCFYLGVEREIIAEQEDFLNDMDNGKDIDYRLYKIDRYKIDRSPQEWGRHFDLIKGSLKSGSIRLFYYPLLGGLFLLYCICLFREICHTQ
jgi:hypothetical protein